jgi:hypothetical protein
MVKRAAQTWSVKITERARRRTEIQVQASSWDEAYAIAQEQAATAVAASEYDLNYDIDPYRADGEPWVKLDGDYEGGSGFYMDDGGRPDVLVFETSKGHVFTNEDIPRLLERIRTITKYTVIRHWNGISETTGEGLSTVSYLVSDRPKGEKLTREQMDSLCAPRED